LIALVPLLLGGLTTIAWQNSHQLAVLSLGLEAVRLDLERTKASLEPGRTIQLRLDRNEKELAHLRDLVEQRLTSQPREK
jgi:urease accessory protein UreE